MNDAWTGISKTRASTKRTMNGQQNEEQTTWRRCVKTIARAAFLLMVSVSLWSCGEGQHGADPGNPGRPIQFVVKVAAVDSATSERLEGVRVAEFISKRSFEEILSGDSIVPFDQPGYYINFGFTAGPTDWLEPWTVRLYYAAYYPQIAAPTYSRFVAYKRGYKIWRWSLERDTVYDSVEYPRYDSLCIRLVKK